MDLSHHNEYNETTNIHEQEIFQYLETNFFETPLNGMMNGVMNYKKIGEGKYLNTTIFSKFGGLKIFNDYKTIYSSIMEKINSKRKILEVGKDMIDKLKGVSEKYDLLISIINHYNLCLEMIELSLPFEIEKIGITIELNNQEINDRIQKINEIAKILYGGKVSENKEEIQLIYEHFNQLISNYLSSNPNGLNDSETSIINQIFGKLKQENPELGNDNKNDEKIIVRQFEKEFEKKIVRFNDIINQIDTNKKNILLNKKLKNDLNIQLQSELDEILKEIIEFALNISNNIINLLNKKIKDIVLELKQLQSSNIGDLNIKEKIIKLLSGAIFYCISKERWINKEKYMQIFDLVADFYGIKMKTFLENCPSIVQSGNKLSIPKDSSYNHLKLGKILELITHEIETHRLIRENNSVLIKDIKGAGYLDREEGTAIFFQNSIFHKGNFEGESLIKLLFIFIGENFDSNFLLDSINLIYKLANIDKNGNDWMLRIKRYFRLGSLGCSLKDTSYFRGSEKILKYLNGGNDPKDLFLGKVGFGDIEIMRKIFNSSNKQLTFPQMISHIIKYILTNEKTTHNDFLKYIQEEYSGLNIDISSVEKLTFRQKKILIKILNLLK